jgi:hypothetical protein
MHARRFACLLLGMWLASSALMTWITIDSFNAAPRSKSMAHDQARVPLDYSARQRAGWRMERWGDCEIVGGIFFFIYLLLGTREGTVTLGISLIPLAAAALQRGFMTPQLLYLGGLPDFASGQLEAVRMGMTLVEALELVSGGILAALLIARQHRRSGLAREEVDAIDKADHGHIDR